MFCSGVDLERYVDHLSPSDFFHYCKQLTSKVKITLKKVVKLTSSKINYCSLQNFNKITKCRAVGIPAGFKNLN